MPGAEADPSRSEPESAPGHWQSGAAQKSGSSATLPLLPYRFRISFKNSKFIFQNKKLNLYLPAVLRSRHFFGQLRLRMANVPEPTPNVKKQKTNKRKPKNTKNHQKHKKNKKHQKTPKNTRKTQNRSKKALN